MKYKDELDEMEIEKEEKEEQRRPQEHLDHHDQDHHDDNDDNDDNEETAPPSSRRPLSPSSPSPLSSPLPFPVLPPPMSHFHPTFEFLRNKHIQYFVHCLKRLPVQYKHLDTNRLTMVHFAVQSLDILQFFDDNGDSSGGDRGSGKSTPNLMEQYNVRKEDIIDWIYSLQIVSPSFAARRQQLDNNLVGQDNNVIHDHTKTNAESGKTDCDNDNCINNNSDGGSDLEWFYWKHAGFKGGTFLRTDQINNTYYNKNNNYIDTNNNNNNSNNDHTKYYNQGHIAMTYTALCTLLTLGDDLQNIDKPSILRALSTLQNPNGSFQCRPSGSECDLRFLYCACAISYLLEDWSGVDVDRAVGYIKSCRSYDGAFGLVSGMEGHGGSTFCAIASLVLMGVIDNGDCHCHSHNDGAHNDAHMNGDDILGSPSWRDELIHWCVMRQIQGMQGRPNKKEDTCYSYWIGGTLRLLGCDHLLDTEALKSFVLGCQSDLGGFSKLEDGIYPDLLHSFYSLSWLSLSGDDYDHGYKYKNNTTQGNDNDGLISLNRLDCSLGMCRRHLENYFKSQKKEEQQ